MKSKLIILTLALILSLFYSKYVAAHEGMTHDEGMEAIDHEKGSMDKNDSMMMNKSADTKNEIRVATEEDVKTLPNVGNKICPVSGNVVDDGKMGEAVKFVYNGKIYNLCCQMCMKDFKKNPEKYSKIAEDEVAKDKSKGDMNSK